MFYIFPFTAPPAPRGAVKKGPPVASSPHESRIARVRRLSASNKKLQSPVPKKSPPPPPKEGLKKKKTGPPPAPIAAKRKKRPSHAELSAATTVAAALKDSTDQEFANDAVNLLNTMTTTRTIDQEKGLDASKLKMKTVNAVTKKSPPPAPSAAKKKLPPPAPSIAKKIKRKGPPPAPGAAKKKAPPQAPIESIKTSTSSKVNVASPGSPRASRIARVRRLSVNNKKLTSQAKATLLSPAPKKSPPAAPRGAVKKGPPAAPMAAKKGPPAAPRGAVKKTPPPAPTGINAATVPSSTPLSPKESRAKKMHRLSTHHTKLSQQDKLKLSGIQEQQQEQQHRKQQKVQQRKQLQQKQQQQQQIKQIKNLQDSINKAKKERTTTKRESKASQKMYQKVQQMLDSSPPPIKSSSIDNTLDEENRIEKLQQQIHILKEKEIQHIRVVTNIDNIKILKKSIYRYKNELSEMNEKHVTLSRNIMQEERNIAWMQTCWSSAIENVVDATDAMQSTRSSDIQSIVDGVHIASLSMKDMVQSLNKINNNNTENSALSAFSSTSPKSSIATLRKERDLNLKNSIHKQAILIERVTKSISTSRDRDDQALSTRYDEFAKQMSLDVTLQTRLTAEASTLFKTHQKEEQRKTLFEQQMEKLKQGADENIRLYKKTKLEKSLMLDELLIECQKREGKNNEVSTEEMLAIHRQKEMNRYEEMLELMREERSETYKNVKLKLKQASKEITSEIYDAVEEKHIQLFESHETTLTNRTKAIQLQQKEIQNMKNLLNKHNGVLDSTLSKECNHVKKMNEHQIHVKTTVRTLKLKIQQMWKDGNIDIKEKIYFMTEVSNHMKYMTSVLELWSNERTLLFAGHELVQIVPEWSRINRLLIFLEQLINESTLHYDAATIMWQELIDNGITVPLVLKHLHHPSFIGAKASNQRRILIKQYKEELLIIPPQYSVLLNRKHKLEGLIKALLVQYKLDTDGKDFLIYDQEHLIDTGSHGLMIKLKNILDGRIFEDDGTEATDVTPTVITSPTANHSQRRGSAVIFQEEEETKTIDHEVIDAGFVFAEGLFGSDGKRFKIKAAVWGSVNMELCFLRLTRTITENLRKRTVSGVI